MYSIYMCLMCSRGRVSVSDAPTWDDNMISGVIRLTACDSWKWFLWFTRPLWCLINEASIRRAPAAIPPVSVLLFIDLEFYQNMISIFQFFSSPSMSLLTVDKTPSTHRLIHFTPDMIRIYCCSWARDECDWAHWIKLSEAPPGVFIYKFLRNYNSKWSQDAQCSHQRL